MQLLHFVNQSLNLVLGERAFSFNLCLRCCANLMNFTFSSKQRASETFLLRPGCLKKAGDLCGGIPEKLD